MLRVRTIYAQSAGAADYYTRYLTEAPGEIPGTWHGNQAAGLGLGGDVASDDLLAILEAVTQDRGHRSDEHSSTVYSLTARS